MSKTKKNKCKLVLTFKCDGGNYIKSSIAKKGTRYKHDIIWLGLKGEFSKIDLEMTPDEAAFVASALCAAIGELGGTIWKPKK